MTFIPGIASPSLGNAHVHPIEERLKQAALQGFKLIEIVEDDLLVETKKMEGGATDQNQAEAARYVKSICDREGVKPLLLQPFWFYEGLSDYNEHKTKIRKLNLWMKLVKILDVQLIQIPTNWLTQGTTGDMDVIVRDLIEMAEIGLAQDPIVSFAYEGVAWGTHIDTWEGTWEVVKRVDRPNFGLCLDTYHIVARTWGDPTKPGCKRPGGDAELQKSMEKLATELDVKKIFYVQFGDAELLSEPLVNGHPFYAEDQLPRMSWSRNARIFAFEDGENGCLPLDLITNTIMKKLNYQGVITMELFSKKTFDPDPRIPAMYAKRAMESWNALMERLQ